MAVNITSATFSYASSIQVRDSEGIVWDNVQIFVGTAVINGTRAGLWRVTANSISDLLMLYASAHTAMSVALAATTCEHRLLPPSSQGIS
jgi:hypothetical protein